ncbi:protein of unknown function DUF983 [Methylocella silvestris BL2]|uniref:DUF983 domain-containing protein n=1 Tax=Methylocella silvestris (strain DSM 15510 / CIP 108128 / LMG 27833 / NCIMB 13906 / BL2) TaxID=395965 RepID=B8EMP7_METSB|nr:DUF983 domain-containing protein [Methylocella silvestris]ACK52726.1 protein of unknown function DUF983 [Methylocella silvestris BL2]
MATSAPGFAAIAPGKDESRDRPIWRSIRRGFMGRCPACGEGRIFGRFLKVNPACPNCGEELHHHRADDAPPYATIFVVGHIIGTLMLACEEFWPDAPIWLHAMVWPTLTLMLSLWFLPRIKGALVAYQWALRMHGFETAPGAQPAPVLTAPISQSAPAIATAR